MATIVAAIVAVMVAPGFVWPDSPLVVPQIVLALGLLAVCPEAVGAPGRVFGASPPHVVEKTLHFQLIIGPG